MITEKDDVKFETNESKGQLRTIKHTMLKDSDDSSNEAEDFTISTFSHDLTRKHVLVGNQPNLLGEMRTNQKKFDCHEISDSSSDYSDSSETSDSKSGFFKGKIKSSSDSSSSYSGETISHNVQVNKAKVVGVEEDGTVVH